MWILGVDPGFSETGLVLTCQEAPDDPLEARSWATYTIKYGNDLARAVSMGAATVSTALDWVYQYNIENLIVIIEQPIFRNNPSTFIKQIRLFQEIEGMFWGAIRNGLALRTNIAIGEVLPTMSKKIAAGSGGANKDEMWAALIEKVPYEWREYNRSSREALVDAYAHALAGMEKRVKLTWHVLSKLEQITLEPVVEGRFVREQ